MRDPALWTAAAIGLWLMALWRPPSVSAPSSLRLWGAWLGWMLICALFSNEPYRSFAAASRPLTAGLVLAMTASHWRADDRELWCRLLVISGLGLGLATLHDFHPNYPHVGLLFPYYNYTVGVEAMAFSICLAALASGQVQTRPTRFALMALMTAFVVLMIVAQSRGGLLACAVVFSLWMLRNRRFAQLGALALAATACLAVSYRIWSPMLKFDRPGAYVRPAIWRSSVEIAQDDPVFGIGPGLFVRGFQKHNFPIFHPLLASRFGMTTEHAHSEPLQAAAETGWPGMMLLLTALVASITAAWSKREKDWTLQAGLFAVAAGSVQALFDNLWNLPSLQWLFFSALAVAQGEQRPSGRVSAWIRPVLALGLLLSSVSWIPDWLARRWDEQGLISNDPSKIEHALNLASGNPGLWEDLARIHLRHAPVEAKAALEALNEAETLAPTNAAYPLMEAEIHASMGQWDAAKAFSERALSLEPQFLEARLVLGDSSCRLGLANEAQEAMRDIDSIRQDQILRFGPVGMSGPLVLRFDEAKYKAISKKIAAGCK